MSMDPSNTSEDAQQGSNTSLSLSKEDLSYIAASVVPSLSRTNLDSQITLFVKALAKEHQTTVS